MSNIFSEGAEVQYRKKFSSAVVGQGDKLRVTSEDGSTATGDVLVGCDGAKSRVREVIIGPEAAKLTGASVNMFNFPYKFDAKLSIQDVPSPPDPLTWAFQVLQS